MIGKPHNYCEVGKLVQVYQLDEHSRLLANGVLGAYMFQRLYNLCINDKLGSIVILSLERVLRAEGSKVK